MTGRLRIVLLVFFSPISVLLNGSFRDHLGDDH